MTRTSRVKATPGGRLPLTAALLAAYNLRHALLNLLARLTRLLLDAADELVRVAFRLAEVRVRELRKLPLELRLVLCKLLLKLLPGDLIEAHTHPLSCPP